MEKPTLKGSEKPGVPSCPSPKELMALPAKKALDVILESLTPARLVQSLAEEDLFWLVQDIGPQDALPILSRASNDQWQYLLDLELWRKDRLEIDSVNRWFDLLLKADPQRFLTWGLHEHIQLIELSLFRNIEVRIMQEDESLSDLDENWFSPDSMFYVRVRDEKYYQVIKEFLDRLAEYDLNRLRQVLLEVTGVLAPETEENIYRLRNVRLAEKGFLPFEEAVGVYQPLSAQSLLEKEPDAQNMVEQPDLFEVIPVSKSLLIQDTDPFFMALGYVEDSHTLERLQMEFSAMCNQIMSADGLVAREKEDLVTVVRKACGYLNIGLRKLTDGDPQKAPSLLEKFPLNQIFRVGFGAALELKWKAEKWIKKSWFVARDLELNFWEDDWEGMLGGLLKKRPLFYAAFSEGSDPYREFKSIEDINRCREALDQIMAVDYLLSLVFAHTPLAHPVKTYQPVSYKNLFLTCWARDHLGQPEKIEPLRAEEFKAFFRDFWAKGKKPYRVYEKMKKSFWDWLALRSGLAANELQTQVQPLDNLFSELEEEYGSVSLQKLDPRYVKHFLVRP
ncbi:MAG: hypothetical protein JW883_10120 [Deltaproteobacteria bacterium]|nr:hypothetical protein [Deltaproteobacteria bacterium]